VAERLHAPRLVPAGKRTTDQGRFLTSLTDWSAFTVAGTAPELRRLPFEPPPPKLALVGGTLIAGLVSRAVKLRSSRLLSGP